MCEKDSYFIYCFVIIVCGCIIWNNVSVKDRDERTKKYLKLFQLEHAFDSQIKSYSHGMKQKICLMASLIHNPKIWILDEPTVGLDIMVYETLVRMIKEFAFNGRTVFVTSHNIDMVSKLCDRVAIINDGVVQKEYDLNADPIKRRDLGKIFFRIYGEKN